MTKVVIRVQRMLNVKCKKTFQGHNDLIFTIFGQEWAKLNVKKRPKISTSSIQNIFQYKKYIYINLIVYFSKKCENPPFQAFKNCLSEEDSKEQASQKLEKSNEQMWAFWAKMANFGQFWSKLVKRDLF